MFDMDVKGCVFDTCSGSFAREVGESKAIQGVCAGGEILLGEP